MTSSGRLRPLEAGVFDATIALARDDVLTSPQLPGFSLPIADLLA